jgi:hypothetical protein
LSCFLPICNRSLQKVLKRAKKFYLKTVEVLETSGVVMQQQMSCLMLCTVSGKVVLTTWPSFCLYHKEATKRQQLLVSRYWASHGGGDSLVVSTSWLQLSLFLALFKSMSATPILCLLSFRALLEGSPINIEFRRLATT